MDENSGIWDLHFFRISQKNITYRANICANICRKPSPSGSGGCGQPGTGAQPWSCGFWISRRLPSCRGLPFLCQTLLIGGGGSDKSLLFAVFTAKRESRGSNTDHCASRLPESFVWIFIFCCSTVGQILVKIINNAHFHGHEYQFGYTRL